MLCLPRGVAKLRIGLETRRLRAELASLSGRLGPRAFRIAVKDAATNRRMIDILSDALELRLSG